MRSMLSNYFAWCCKNKRHFYDLCAEDFEESKNNEPIEAFDTEKLVARIEKISVFLYR